MADKSTPAYKDETQTPAPPLVILLPVSGAEFSPCQGCDRPGSRLYWRVEATGAVVCDDCARLLTVIGGALGAEVERLVG